jgi:crotonobetainyl-CoA:carnitine CoA-transferase CaiB-like acyl-CoA transferase
MGDLSGLLVVALEQAVAAPFASRQLADAGARVIKIERPEGDFARAYDRLVRGESAYFVWLNRGKQSVRLDLKDAGDLALVHRMAARADVFLQNLAPGAASRLGLGAASLLARHPRLVHCSISGYGESGPLRDQKAYDLLVQAEAGLSAITGGPEGPARVGISVCDIAAGVTAHAAILQALYARERTGRGRAVEVSLFHALADWMGVPYLQTRYGGRPPAREGLRHPTIAPYGAFPCRDGRALLLSIQNEREWARFCGGVLGDAVLAVDPRFATMSARVANRAELDARVARAFALSDREAMAARLGAAGIAFGRLSDMADMIAHPQHRLVGVETPSGPVEMPGPGARVAGEEPAFGPVPAPGGHDEAIREEFGG